MRIRQSRPELHTDPVTGRYSWAVKGFYQALWQVCDDEGWMRWDVSHLGATLDPYSRPTARERTIAKLAETLEQTGRLRIEPCGHAVIPSLPRHQKIGGRRAQNIWQEHQNCARSIRSQTDTYGPHGKERNVTVGNGTREGLSTEFRQRVQRPA